MAATFALALAQVPERELAAVAYASKPINRAPEDRELGAFFARLDPDWQARLAGRLIRRSGFTRESAEEALSQELLFLIERRRDVFLLETDRWLGLLFVRGRYRLLKNHSAPPLASTNAIEEALGDAALAQADICVSESPQAEVDAISVPLPNPGETWSRSQVISALQRFHRYYGRPPRARECRIVNRLPSPATIRRHFPALRQLSWRPGSSQPNTAGGVVLGRTSRLLVPAGRFIGSAIGPMQATGSAPQTSPPGQR